MKRLLVAFVAVLLLASCDAPAQVTPRNIALLQSAQKGALGAPGLIEFYSNDCVPCRKIQGTMLALDERYTRRVQFIYIDVDRDDSKPFLAQYNVRGMPTIVLLDKQGRVTANVAGWLGDQAMTDALDKLVSLP